MDELEQTRAAGQRLDDTVVDVLGFLEAEARTEGNTLFQCPALCDHPYCVLTRGLGQYRAALRKAQGA